MLAGQRLETAARRRLRACGDVSYIVFASSPARFSRNFQISRDVIQTKNKLDLLTI